MSDKKKKIPEKIAVIDSDTGSSNLTVKYLLAFGVKSTQVFLDAHEGYEAVMSGKFDAAVIDWKIKGLSALALLSRIRRSQEHATYPVIITSGTIKKEEFKILNEYACTELIEKPFSQLNLEGVLHRAEREKDWFDINRPALYRLVDQHRSEPAVLIEEAKKIIKDFSASDLVLPELANQLVVMGESKSAIELFKKILEQDPKNIPAMQGLAKSLSLSGDSKQALEILEKAHEICPVNIDRLELMGELEISTQDAESAAEHFKNALSIDPERAKSKVGLSVANAMKKGDTVLFSGTPSIARALNNLAIVLSKKGETEKAVKYYIMSLSFLADKALQIKVTFNIGMGYTRGKMHEQAKKWLDKALIMSDGEMTKARTVLDHIEAIEAQEASSGGVASAVLSPSVAIAEESFMKPKSSQVTEVEETQERKALENLIADIDSIDMGNLSDLDEVA